MPKPIPQVKAGLSLDAALSSIDDDITGGRNDDYKGMHPTPPINIERNVTH